MTCPKCKATVGIMGQEIILEYGIVKGCRCIICGYWEFDHLPNPNNIARIYPFDD